MIASVSTTRLRRSYAAPTLIECPLNDATSSARSPQRNAVSLITRRKIVASGQRSMTLPLQIGQNSQSICLLSVSSWRVERHQLVRMLQSYVAPFEGLVEQRCAPQPINAPKWVGTICCASMPSAPSARYKLLKCSSAFTARIWCSSSVSLSKRHVRFTSSSTRA